MRVPYPHIAPGFSPRTMRHVRMARLWRQWGRAGLCPPYVCEVEDIWHHTREYMDL